MKHKNSDSINSVNASAPRRHKILSKIETCLIILLIAGFAVLAIWYVRENIMAPSYKSVSDAYQEAKDSAFQKAYDASYAKSFERAEKENHVSNRLTISIGNVKEMQKLEVLHASKVTYENSQNDNSNFWEIAKDFINGDAEYCFGVIGYGVFTVNLKSGEFITDPVHHHVLARIPLPVLTDFTLDHNHIEPLFYEKGGIFNNSAADGVKIADEALQKAAPKLRQEMLDDQELYEKAKGAAKSILTNIIRQTNPMINDLTVDVEFY